MTVGGGRTAAVISSLELRRSCVNTRDSVFPSADHVSTPALSASGVSCAALQHRPHLHGQCLCSYVKQIGNINLCYKIYRISCVFSGFIV